MKHWWSPKQVFRATHQIRTWREVQSIRVCPSAVGCLCVVLVFLVDEADERDVVRVNKRCGALFGSVGRSGVEFEIIQTPEDPMKPSFLSSGKSSCCQPKVPVQHVSEGQVAPGGKYPSQADLPVKPLGQNGGNSMPAKNLK